MEKLIIIFGFIAGLIEVFVILAILLVVCIGPIVWLAKTQVHWLIQIPAKLSLMAIFLAGCSACMTALVQKLNEDSLTVSTFESGRLKGDLIAILIFVGFTIYYLVNLVG